MQPSHSVRGVARNMEKKLYCVKVILYVMAENASEASVAATKAKFDIFECSARKAEHVDAGWENGVPYNADDERTCAEIMSAQPASASASTFLPRSIRQELARRGNLINAVQSSPR